MKGLITLVYLLLLFPTVIASNAFGAYHHANETDSDIVLEVYPEIKNTKLDSCALCHTGGEYEKKPGKFVSLGSCQWCHYSYGYDGSGNIASTLNPYGEEYGELKSSIGGADALVDIENNDSDGDGYINIDEIAALRFPGNPDDDPEKVPAPSLVISLEELEELGAHSQFMLMNTHKSGDFYAEYMGVPMEELLDHSGILSSASGITVFAPDGWAQYHPLEEDSDPLMYHVYGIYPEAEFFYNTEADEETNPDIGWCDYSAPAREGLEHGDMIRVEYGLKMLLAYKRDDSYLQPGELSKENKLDGEGPFRVVPPQKVAGPPDQSVKSDFKEVIWPFDELADHNAGFATRSATIIRVEPLPEGTTDIDTLEAGWSYVDEKKIVIYGAIDPTDTILAELAEMKRYIGELDNTAFKEWPLKENTLKKISTIEKSLLKGHTRPFKAKLSALIDKVDGCKESGIADDNDWLIDCDSQQTVYWTAHGIEILSNP